MADPPPPGSNWPNPNIPGMPPPPRLQDTAIPAPIYVPEPRNGNGWVKIVGSIIGLLATVAAGGVGVSHVNDIDDRSQAAIRVETAVLKEQIKTLRRDLEAAKAEHRAMLGVMAKQADGLTSLTREVDQKRDKPQRSRRRGP